MTLAGVTLQLMLLLGLVFDPPVCLAVSTETAPPQDRRLNGPTPTTILVRVVAHGSMVLGREVGGARVTITDVASGQILASGLQQGETGDQNQIMRTPHLIDEPRYSSRATASFTGSAVWMNSRRCSHATRSSWPASRSASAGSLSVTT